MGALVVMATQQTRVVEIGGAAVEQRDPVVGFGPSARELATLAETGLVSEQQRLALCPAEEALAAAEIKDFINPVGTTP